MFLILQVLRDLTLPLLTNLLLPRESSSLFTPLSRWKTSVYGYQLHTWINRPKIRCQGDPLLICAKVL